ncbi:MAG: serpin family protein [Sedimentisphaerales bacterium]|nr:serpin family protein [Sedimentisphaerales bacterium]
MDIYKLFGILVLIGNVVTSVAGSEAPPEITDALVAGNNMFALELYGRLKDEPTVVEQGGNLFFSPYSISTALAMTYAGARGETAQQMADVLHFDLPDATLHETFGRLAQALRMPPKNAPYELRIANALWGRQGYEFRPEFLELVGEHYGGGLRQVDFIKQTEAAREMINQWVQQQTNDKIKNLIAPGVLTPQTRLVLTNAIYFLGTWVDKFDPERTRTEPFWLNAEKSVDAELMRQTTDFYYAEDDAVQILQLPYKGGRMAMLILLPREKDGLGLLEKQLTTDWLRNRLKNMDNRSVNVSLPKFKLTHDFSLKKILPAIGMKHAFDIPAGSADFSGMADFSQQTIDRGRGLFIDDVVHKAFVDVNETGTEAAAATAVVMAARAMPKPPVVFRADRPFIFLIRDNATGGILFMGRLGNPAL